MRKITSQVMTNSFENYLLENPSVAKAIIEKALLALELGLLQKRQEKRQDVKAHLML